MTNALTQYQTILCELDVTTCAPESKLEQDLRQDIQYWEATLAEQSKAAK